MQIKQLSVRQFRNYETGEVSLPSGLICIVGPNGSGKTNLLEAAYMSCTAVSHRTTRDSELVRWSSDYFVVKAAIEKSASNHLISITYKVGVGKEVSIDDISVNRRSDLLQVAAAVIFSPDDLALIKGPPNGRRQFLDRLAVYLDRRHLAELSQLRSILQQRNSLLYELRARRTSPTLAGLFDDQFVSLSSRLRQRRFKVLTLLVPILQSQIASLGINERISVAYLENGNFKYESTDHDPLQISFWESRALADIDRLSADEQQRATTLWGPQRDDLLIMVNGRDSRIYASQGQQRSLVLALKQAESILLERALGSPPVLLLDDVLSELDASRSQALLRLAASHEQTILTATDSAVPLLTGIQPSAVFRVLSGKIYGDG